PSLQKYPRTTNLVHNSKNMPKHALHSFDHVSERALERHNITFSEQDYTYLNACVRNTILAGSKPSATDSDTDIYEIEWKDTGIVLVCVWHKMDCCVTT